MSPGRPAPTLPHFVTRPLALLPKAPARLFLQQALNFVFAEHLRSGEIDFLDQRCLNVRLNDAGIEFTMSLRHRKLAVQPAAAQPDLRIAGSTWAFLQLANRAEDSDTLFFRRELSTTGDTDLGLFVKNFLDGLEPETLPLHHIFQPALRIGLRALGMRHR